MAKHRGAGRASRKTETAKSDKPAKHVKEETKEDRRRDAVTETARERDDAVRLIPPREGKHRKS